MFILRAFIYLFSLAGVAILISLEGYHSKTLAVYSEHTLTEHMQDFMTSVSCMMFLYASRLNPKLRIASILLAALLGMMYIREQDALLDTHVFHGAWKLFVVCVLIAVICFLKGKKLSETYNSLKAYSELPCYGMFISGAIIVLAFSRLIGQGSFWMAVMGDNYVRVVKNIVEEGTETLGYSLMFMSAVELILVGLKHRRSLKIERS